MAKIVNAFDKVVTAPEKLPTPPEKIGMDHGPDMGMISVDGQEHTIVIPECGCFTGKYMAYDHGMDHYVRIPDHPDNWSIREGWFRQTNGVSCGTCNRLAFQDGIGYCAVDHE